jgi:hypothetical protein
MLFVREKECFSYETKSAGGGFAARHYLLVCKNGERLRSFGELRELSHVFLGGVNIPESLWKDRVANAIDNQLLTKGWRKVDQDADATVIAIGSAHTERTFETWYNGMPGDWAHRGWLCGPGYTTTTIDRIRVGELHIDVFDAHTKKVIWRASATGTLAGKSEKNQKKLDRRSQKPLKTFPPPPKN